MSEQRNKLQKWAKGEATEKEGGGNESKVTLICPHHHHHLLQCQFHHHHLLTEANIWTNKRIV